MYVALRISLLTSLLTASVVSFAGAGLADTPVKTLDANSENAAVGVGRSEPSKNPKEKKGISPFWVTMKAGDTAYVSHDFDQALVSYRAALKLDPQSALGHYRLGEAELAKHQLTEALASFEAALRFARDDPALKSKVLFVLADLAERARSFDDARGKWNAYAEHAATNPNIKAFPKTAIERSQRIDTSQALEKDYAAVKERIKQREADANARAIEKKP